MTSNGPAAARMSRSATIPGMADRMTAPRGDDDVPAELAPAGALAHPSRRRIAGELAGSPDGLTVADIARRVGLHHNAVRQHLATLAAAGVVASARDAPAGRGRPTARYWLIDDQAPRVAAHQELLRLLVGLVARSGIAEDEVEEHGREAGERIPIAPGREGLLASVAQLGFAPREVGAATDAAEGVLDLALDFCPFRDAVLAPGGEAICTLHRGLMEGLSARVAPGAEVTRFEPRDPRLAGCRVRVAGLRGTPQTD